MDAGHEVLVRTADLGPTYVATTWLDGDDVTLGYQVVARDELDPLLDQVRHGLVAPLPGESAPDATRRALADGVFADRERSRELGERLGAVVVPQRRTGEGHAQASFWEELDRRAASGPVLVRITPSRTTATLPWELLRGPDGRTLLELATIVYEVPTVALADRVLSADAYVAPPFDPSAPALYTIDPRVPRAARLGPVLDYDVLGRAPLLDALGVREHERTVSRERLAEQLGAVDRPGRWLYVGHVSTRHDQPGSASLHLSDTRRDGEVVLGTAALVAGVHRPFTALDLVLGTAEHDDWTAGLDPSARMPGPPGLRGSQLWPMPARVAFVACESGSDHASTETFGLVVAAMSNGAHDVTSTRWTMPTDRAFRLFAGVDASPTSDLARAVDLAHQAADPVAALRAWQLAEQALWTTTGDPRHSPLLYAGVTTHHAHVRRPGA